MPRYELATIVDQVEMHQLRTLQIRLAVCTLVDGKQDGFFYLRFSLEPGQDLDAVIANQNLGIANVYGGAVQGIDKAGADHLHALADNIHTPAVNARFQALIRDKNQPIRMANGVLRVPFQSELPTQRDWLTVAGANFVNDRASILNGMVVDRARVMHVNFGLVVCSGAREVFNHLHKGRVPPGADARELSLAMTDGLQAALNHPPVSAEGTAILENAARSVHTPRVVQRYSAAYQLWRQRVISKGLDPDKRTPEIDPTDGIDITGARRTTVVDFGTVVPPTDPRTNAARGAASLLQLRRG